jgi:hypothetical protein
VSGKAVNKAPITANDNPLYRELIDFAIQKSSRRSRHTCIIHITKTLGDQGQLTDLKPAIRNSLLLGSSSALCEALHKSDYAKPLIMESCITVLLETLVWQCTGIR